MAKFEISEKITGGNEGGYADNKADRGGETYAGIARNFHPNWNGWVKIDEYKADYKKAKDKGKTKLSLAQWVNASADVKKEPVHKMVSDFYKKQFWDVNKLDEFKDQQLADTVYDFGVNSGTNRSAKYIQRVVRVAQDGIIGKNTLEAINNGDAEVYHTQFNTLRRDFYNSIAKGNQAQFLPSWLRRLKPYKK